ncbi:hypothetical protein DK842_21740 [Chromobacterium phragmitis]|uniref:Uncharacterized protein n=1 Tax=Chromobacterium phragmitis TaxID=2202141 RepID=A0A344UEE6_9NEIS|nr:hypothetical protein [Chromobacterium phragmitis]AXE32304.1 hypothetical protein DK842_21740 [Chromobacterium phragmitis]AXE33644.1 hypothetical protein DK843_04480 [Chromobacterium phragmitis]
MSVSSTDTSNGYWQQRQSLHQQRRHDFSQLTQSVQQGDLAGAQQALAALQQLSGNPNAGSGSDFSAMLTNAISATSSASGASATNADNPFASLNAAQNASSGSSGGNTIASLLNALGQDLQAGNLSQAQQAFQQLQQGLQQADAAQPSSGHHRHHHRHGGGEQQQQNDSLASVLGAASGNAASGNNAGSALASLNQQQTQAALSLFQANAGGNDIGSLLMAMSI